MQTPTTTKRPYKTLQNNEMNGSYNFDRSVISNAGRSNRIILHGRRDIGKTSLAKFYLCYYCIVVEDLKTDLNKFDPSIHEGIVFENIDFRYVGPFYIMMLLFCPEKMVEYDYCNVVIPLNTTMIFTTSIDNGRIFNDNLWLAYRRCTIIPILEPTYQDDSDDDDDDWMNDVTIAPPPERVVRQRREKLRPSIVPSW